MQVSKEIRKRKSINALERNQFSAPPQAHSPTQATAQRHRRWLRIKDLHCERDLVELLSSIDPPRILSFTDFDRLHQTSLVRHLRRTAGDSSPLVNRTAPVDHRPALWETLFEARVPPNLCHTVIELLGESGCGKTALCYKLAARWLVTLPSNRVVWIDTLRQFNPVKLIASVVNVYEKDFRCDDGKSGGPVHSCDLDHPSPSLTVDANAYFRDCLERCDIHQICGMADLEALLRSLVLRRFPQQLKHPVKQDCCSAELSSIPTAEISPVPDAIQGFQCKSEMTADYLLVVDDIAGPYRYDVGLRHLAKWQAQNSTSVFDTKFADNLPSKPLGPRGEPITRQLWKCFSLIQDLTCVTSLSASGASHVYTVILVNRMRALTQREIDRLQNLRVRTERYSRNASRAYDENDVRGSTPNGRFEGDLFSPFPSPPLSGEPCSNRGTPLPFLEEVLVTNLMEKVQVRGRSRQLLSPFIEVPFGEGVHARILLRIQPGKAGLRSMQLLRGESFARQSDFSVFYKIGANETFLPYTQS